MVVLHLPGGIDFFGFDATIRVLAQFHQSTTRSVGRGGKQHAIVVDRGGTIDTHSICGLVVPPQEFAIRRSDADKCLRCELRVLALAVEIYCYRRGVTRSSSAEPTGAAR